MRTEGEGATRQERPILVHVIAECRDCGWENSNHIEGVQRAYEHHRKTGHEVTVETGYVKTLRRRQGGGKG